jgi:hypothetical protein
MDAFAKKRQINQTMLDGLRHSDHPVAFFCECDRDDCYQPAWLSCHDYEQNLQLESWRALSGTHWERPQQDNLGSELAISA